MKYKRYFHFDKIMSLEQANKYINNIDKHQYLPFITYKKDKNKWDENHNKLNEFRTISISSIKDNYVYQHYNELLSKKYDELISNTDLDNCVCAYRKGKNKCNIDFFAETFYFLKKSKKARIFIGDIHHFFDNLDHKILKDKLKTVLETSEIDDNTYKMLQSLEKASYIELDDIITFLNGKGIYIKTRKNKYRDICNYCLENNIPTIVKQEWFRELKKDYLKPSKEDLKNKTKGIVQGAPVSGTLSNIYMLDVDKKINELLSGYEYLYRRYCDDFILIIRKVEDDIYKEIINKVKNILILNKLELKESKIQEFYYNKGIITGTKKFIQFLGFEIHNSNEVKIRQSTFDRQIHKLLRSKKYYNMLKEFISEEELKKYYREKNYNKLENVKTKKYKQRTIGSYISKAINIINSEKLKTTKKEMINLTDKHIN